MARFITASTVIACVLTGSANAEIFRFAVQHDQSSAEITYGLGVFQPQPVYQDQLTSGVSGWIDMDVTIVDGVVTNVALVDARLEADPVLDAFIDAGGIQANATLNGLAVDVIDPGPAFFNPNTDTTGFVNQQDMSVGYEGVLNVDIGQPLDPIDLSQQVTDYPGLGVTYELDGDVMTVEGFVFIQGGDFGDPVFPGGPNLAYFGQFEVVAVSRVPAPGSAALLVGLGLASTRRRRS